MAKNDILTNVVKTDNKNLLTQHEPMHARQLCQEKGHTLILVFCQTRLLATMASHYILPIPNLPIANKLNTHTETNTIHLQLYGK